MKRKRIVSTRPWHPWPIRASTCSRIRAIAASMLLSLGGFILPANAEERPEELRPYTAEEIAVSGTDGNSITQSDQNNGIHVTKSLQNNQDGTLQIELESWITGNSRRESIPLDVVLVLDTSGSMRLDYPGAANRMEALKQAAASFVNAIEEQNQNAADGRQSRIGLVQYCDASGSGIRNHLTTVDEGGKNALCSAIQAMSYGGRTRTDEGLRYAEELMNGEADSGRSRAVILFTDGYPSNEEYDGFVMDTANRTLATARSMKEQGIELFTISIEPEASVNAGGALPTYVSNGQPNYTAAYYDMDANTSDANMFALGNRFMHLVSSNNPHAQNMDVPNAWDGSDAGQTTVQGRGSYYYKASTASELTEVFRQMAQDVGTADCGLGASAQVRDFIRSPFYRDSDRSVRVFTSDYLGGDAWGDRQDVTGSVQTEVSAEAVKVSGFDYAANYVSEPVHPGSTTGFRGRKLIVSFTIRPQTIFGGNHLPTNGSSSGVYANADTQTAEILYPVPAADLKLRGRIEMKDQNVYVPDKVNLESLMNIPEGWKPDGTKNAYVSLHYELKIRDSGQKVAVMDVPAGKSLSDCAWSWESGAAETASCGEYVLTCRVEPLEAGHYEAVSLEVSGTVHVFHPELTFTDSTVYLGDPADAAAGDTTGEGKLGEHLTALTWKCPDGTASVPEEEPELGYRIAIPSGLKEENGQLVTAQKEDIPVIVGVYRKEGSALTADITSYAEYQHTCKKTGCGYEKREGKGNGERFLIHIMEKPMKEKVDLPNTGGSGREIFFCGAAALAIIWGAWKLLGGSQRAN